MIGRGDMIELPGGVAHAAPVGAKVGGDPRALVGGDRHSVPIVRRDPKHMGIPQLGIGLHLGEMPAAVHTPIQGAIGEVDGVGVRWIGEDSGEIEWAFPIRTPPIS